jgi:hypothetical protein
MQEQKNYILHSIKTILNVEEPPYELTTASGLEKFLTNHDQDTLIISYLPSKECKIIQNSQNLPKEGSLIYITKFKTESSLKNFYNINVRPAQTLKSLASYIKNIYEPIINRENNSSVVQLK